MKRILFISPEFFQYYEYIIEELRMQGYEVDRYRDLPSTDTLTRGLHRIDPALVKRKTDSYFKRICNETSEKRYETVLLLYGMTFSFSYEHIKKLKALHPHARFVLYMWDSVKNLKHASEIFSLCDSIFSFEPDDAVGNIRCLPLFYTEMYENVANIKADEKYFAAYIGTAHPQKLKDINEMSSLLAEKYPNQFIYHYMPSKLKFIFHKLKNPEYKKIKYSDLRSEKLSADRIAQVLSQSRCILDAPQSGQKGLTMRTFEVLGAKKKLITSNASISSYDFYRPENIYIYRSGEPFDFDSDFFTKSYSELPSEIYEKYSLRNWVKTLLN